MSNFKGTPKPWDKSKCQLSGSVNIGNGLIFISNVDTRTFCGQDLTEENEANALLISKAPELLEYLQMHIDSLDLSNIQFYNKYGFNVSELTPKTRNLIKEATEL